MDSGGWSIALKEAEKLLKSLGRRKQIVTNRLDVEYDRLEAFLKMKGEGFNFDYDARREIVVNEDHIFGQDFAHSFAKFEECYANSDYEQALRDLRALVQPAEEFVMKKTLNIQPEKDASVQKLGSILVEKNILDDGLKHWFMAFSSIANESSHKLYPSKSDLSDYVMEKRIMITFQIGRQLISEMEKILAQPRQEALNPESYVAEPSFIVKLPRKDRKQIHEETTGLSRKGIRQ